jgi:ABC-type spermidine/putrescine transport system permease subunit II
VSASRDKSKPILVAYTVVLLSLIYVPILMVVVLSFNSSQNIGLPFNGFSLVWYNGAVGFQGVSGFFSDRQALEALTNSSYIAILTSAVTVLVTVTAAMSLRRRYRGRNFYLYAILASFIVPGILVGLGNSFLYNFLGNPQTLLDAVPVQVVYALPFALILILPRFDPELERYEDAAKVLGANGWQVFRRITLPLILFQLIGVALFSFVLSWGELSRTAFVSHGLGTLPVYLFARLASFAPTPEFYAIGTVVTGVAVVGVVITGYLLTKGQRSLI